MTTDGDGHYVSWRHTALEIENDESHERFWKNFAKARTEGRAAPDSPKRNFWGRAGVPTRSDDDEKAPNGPE